MNKTKIEWCDRTWNPVTGCFHKCQYCYARKIAHRFGGASETHYNDCVGEECQWCTESTGKIHELEEPIYDVDRGINAPYPFEFDPTFHKYRLDEPQKVKNPQNIFVCSMADLFGDWVPDEWIEQVFEACEKSTQHRYMFLTKNPQRYCSLADEGKLPDWDNFWYGSTITKPYEYIFAGGFLWNTFISIEPIREKIQIGMNAFGGAKWIIVGAETGNRKGKVVPEKEWVDEIANTCDYVSANMFMKDSLVSIVGEDNMRREFPWK